MKPLRGITCAASVFLLSALLFAAPAADEAKPTAKANEPATKFESQEQRVAHGKYLVHHVAQCIQCHTPRDRRGDLDRSRLLTGAPIPVVGPAYSRPWAAESVWLAGLRNYDESFVRYLLTHGVKPDGTRPKPPMPSFQLNEQDANAVIAYLKSLGTSAEE